VERERMAEKDVGEKAFQSGKAFQRKRHFKKKRFRKSVSGKGVSKACANSII
jgi:hypothetical protein